jgi:hypothetical protein
MVLRVYVFASITYSMEKYFVMGKVNYKLIIWGWVINGCCGLLNGLLKASRGHGEGIKKAC